MNNQLFIIEGLNNDRLQDLYRDASAVRTSKVSLQSARPNWVSGLLVSMSGLLARIGVTNRPSRTQAEAVAGR